MVWAAPFFRSTVGKKIVMAVTGIVMFGFLIGHMAGNLQAFLGAEKIDEYAKFLKQTPALLWGTRLVLIVSLALHVWAAVSLTLRNRASRPVRYTRYTPIVSRVPSRTMMITGVLLLVFVVYHLLHFTIGVAHPTYNSAGGFNLHTVYANIVSGFSVWWVALIYVVMMVLLAWHLFHGVWSVFQSLGLNHPKWNRARRVFAVVMTVVVAGGFLLVPLAVVLGILAAPPAAAPHP